MNGFECYVDYLAVKRHFTTDSYNYDLYNGKTSASVKSYQKRSDCYWFEKLARHYDPHGLIVSNILHKPSTYSRSLASEEAEKIYTAWKRKTQNLYNVVRTDLELLEPNFNDNFIVKNQEQPPLLRLFFSKKISFETLTIICALTGCGLKWDQQLTYDPAWDSISLLTKKYPAFLKYDTSKIKGLILTHFSENVD